MTPVSIRIVALAAIASLPLLAQQPSPSPQPSPGSSPQTTAPPPPTTPQRSEIKGHIIDVAPKGQGGENGRVTIQFDQAQLKGGQSLAIRSVIQSIAPPGTSTEPGAAGGPAAGTAGSGMAASSAAGSA